MIWIEMLHQHKGEAAVSGNVTEELLESLQSAG